MRLGQNLFSPLSDPRAPGSVWETSSLPASLPAEASRSLQKPPEASRSHQKPSRSLQKPPEASRSLQKPPAPHGLRCESALQFGWPCGLRCESASQFERPCGLRLESPSRMGRPCGAKGAMSRFVFLSSRGRRRHEPFCIFVTQRPKAPRAVLYLCHPEAEGATSRFARLRRCYEPFFHKLKKHIKTMFLEMPRADL